MSFPRPRLRRGLAALAMLLLAACASEDLQSLEAEVAALSERVAADPVPEGTTLGWRELSDHATREGPGFLSIALTEARSRSALDARRQGRRPQVSLLIRSRLSSAAGSSGLTSASTAGIGLEYDVAAALLGFDEESLDLTDDLIGVQRTLAERQARVRLLDAYASHAELRFDLSEARLVGEGLQCDLEDLRTQVDLGRAPPEALRLLQSRRDEHARATRLLGDQIQLFADRVLSQAGYRTGHPIAATASGLPRASTAALTPETCYAQSGAERRDALLLRLSELALEQAEISRFTQITALLPTQIDPTRGLDLDFLIAWIVPLIDQGETRRRVLDARLDLLALALSAKAERLRFETLVSDARADLAARQLDLVRETSEAEARPAADTATGAAICRSRVAEKQTEADLARLRFKLDIASARLAIACGA